MYLSWCHVCSVEVRWPASIRTLASATALSERRLHHLGHQLVQLHQPMEPQGGFHHRTAQSQDVRSNSTHTHRKIKCFKASEEYSVCRVCAIIRRLCRNVQQQRNLLKENTSRWIKRLCPLVCVCRSPLNEDVFAARSKEFFPVTHEEIKDLQAKIYKLFLQVIYLFIINAFIFIRKVNKNIAGSWLSCEEQFSFLTVFFMMLYSLCVFVCMWHFSHSLLCVASPQPVHNNGSSGYGSLGSNGSHEHYISVASSSDSNGNLWEDSHREPVSHHSDITCQEARSGWAFPFPQG